SRLAAAPSITSNPKSPAPVGVNFSASSEATCFTSASSEPTTAWVFALSALVFVFDIGDFIARAASIYKGIGFSEDDVKGDRRRLNYQAAKPRYCQRVEDNAFHLNARAASAGPAAARRIYHLSSLRFDFVNASTAFHFHDLITQQSGAFEFQ